MKITIRSIGYGPVLQYAKQELMRLLKQYSNHQVGTFPGAQREIVLECKNRPAAESDGSYKIVSRVGFGGTVLSIISDYENGVLAGVYDVLERMGLLFQMNGPVCKAPLDITACDEISVTCTPFCRHRGIRQHINFPMDISAYHIEDAREYIRNLARMGLNSITFHSYTGQWHGYSTQDQTVYAGNYFYGQRHVVPEYAPIAEHVDNYKYYCIPEIEDKLASEQARHEFSIRWLNQVMEVCKQTGLHITLSIELPEDMSTDGLLEMVKGVLHSYPLMDTLEWISPEGGGGGESFALDRLEDKVQEYFGEAPFKDGVLPYVPERLPESLPGSMASLKRAVDLYSLKDEILEGMEQKRIAIGLYVMCRETLRFLKNIMVSVLPGDVLLTFLPAHGSLAVADNIAFMDFTEAELQRTLIYSWIEFDGNMYLQQNSNKGIEALLAQTCAVTAGKSVYGMCFNHWRTAENEIVAGYMAKATARFLTTGAFYKYYAAKQGIGKAGDFISAMELLEKIDCFNRDHLFNIGFCYLGCWLMYPGLGWIRGWKRKHMQQAVTMYETVLIQLEGCLGETQTVSGIDTLRFFMNRIQCSILQIQCILELNPICTVANDQEPQALREEQKEWINRQCDKAMERCRQYIDLHMELLPDRGCQGTAVSYYATLPVYIDHIRQYFVCGEKECTHQPESFDAPPPPDTAYLQ